MPDDFWEPYNDEEYDSSSSKQDYFPTSDDELVRREPISKSCKITQADNLNRRRRLSRKAQCFK